MRLMASRRSESVFSSEYVYAGSFLHTVARPPAGRPEPGCFLKAGLENTTNFSLSKALESKSVKIISSCGKSQVSLRQKISQSLN